MAPRSHRKDRTPPSEESATDTGQETCSLAHVVRGVSCATAPNVARLFYQSFGAPLAGLALPRDREAGIALLAASICLEEVYAALDAQGHLLGVAFITGHGRSRRIQREALVAAFGRLGGMWRYAAYQVFFSHPRAFPRAVRGLEGFSVEGSCRSRGIGAAMLAKMIEDARSEGASAIELNVGDNNPARHLYERFGFRATRTASTGIFAKRLGFKRFVYYELQL